MNQPETPFRAIGSTTSWSQSSRSWSPSRWC